MKTRIIKVKGFEDSSEGLVRKNCPTMPNVSNWHLKYYSFPSVSWKKSMHVSPWKMRNYTLPFSCPSLIKSLAINITHFFMKIMKLKLFWKVFSKIILKKCSLIFYKTKIYRKFEIFFYCLKVTFICSILFLIIIYICIVIF